MMESTPSPEDWTNIRVLEGVTFHFGWQIEKDLTNRRRHGYSLAEAITVILSDEGVEDPDHASGEERWKVIAPAPSGRLLVAVYQDVSEEGGIVGDTWIRIVSLYDAGPTETLAYGG